MSHINSIPFGLPGAKNENDNDDDVVKERVVPLGVDAVRKHSTLQGSDDDDHDACELEKALDELEEEARHHHHHHQHHVGFEVTESSGIFSIKPTTTSTTGGDSDEHDDEDSTTSKKAAAAANAIWDHLGKSDESSSCAFSQLPRDNESADEKLMHSMNSGGSFDDGDLKSDRSAAGCACNQTKFYYWVYISSAAVIGTTLRVYMSRLFGEDCEMGENAVQDVFTPFFSKICITAGGRTIQTGGALFRDWPANLLGCFCIGIITSNQHSSPFPWFSKDHPIQQNRFLHTSFGVGLCGCLTTFASWNSQMVIMMDGTYTVLGRQIAPALTGYVLGMMGCVTSFRVGREASSWFYHRVNKPRAEDDNLSTSSRRSSYLSAAATNNTLDGSIPLPTTLRIRKKSKYQISNCFRPEWTLHIVALLIILLITLVGDLANDNNFYKNMTVTTLMAPLGALTRWKMSNWNSANHPPSHKQYFPWLPWGTLLANLTGAIISILCQGLLDRYSDSWLQELPWTKALLYAIAVGYAGSLSTVSSFVKEIVNLQEKYPGHAKPFIYGTLTIVVGGMASLICYIMIVRIGA